MNTNRSWRLSTGTYKKMANKIISEHHKHDEWMESLAGKWDNDELMARIMLDNDPEHANEWGVYINQLYVCKSFDMEDDFIKDAIYINSGLAILGMWDDKIVDWVVSIHDKRIYNNYNTGNAFEDIKEAVETGYFKDIPEYDAFLKSFLKQYYEFSDKLMKYKPKKTNNPKELAKDYIVLGDIASKLYGYTVEIWDRLDWNAIKAYNSAVSDIFFEEHNKMRKPGSPAPTNEDNGGMRYTVNKTTNLRGKRKPRAKR